MTKASRAPGAVFNGPSWAPPLRIPPGTRFSLTTSAELGGNLASGHATLKDAVTIDLDGRRVELKAGTSPIVAFQWVPQSGARQRAPEMLGHFTFGGLNTPFVVANFTAVEVPQPGARGGGLHRAPVPAGTVLVFEVR